MGMDSVATADFATYGQPMRSAEWRSCVPLIVAAVATVACGSTVPLAGAQVGATVGDGLSVGTVGEATVAPDQPLAGGGITGGPGSSGSSAAVAGSGNLPPAADGSARSTRTATGETAGAVAGVRDTTPVRVGILHLEGGNQALSAGFGNTPVSFGDGRLEAQAVVDDVNRNGGVGGRKIVPFFAAVQAQNANGAGLEAACRKLVEDDKVSVIASMFNVRSQLVECAKKGRAILLDVALGAGDDNLYRQYADTLFTPTQLNLDSEQRLVISNASASGQLRRAKVGVVIQQDDQTFQRVYDRTIRPVLTELGTPVQSSSIANATSTNDIAAAVLKFKTDGVSHVMFSAGNGGIPALFFMQGAEQQAYAPQYLMGDSTNTWFVGDTAPRNQVRNITGAGTYPIANVNASQYATTPAEKRCLDVISAAGERLNDRHSSLTATFYCEMLYGFAAIGGSVSGKLDNASFRSAYYRMGSNYPAITTFRSNLANGRNDNPATYRLLGWKQACSCITYLSDERPLPF